MYHFFTIDRLLKYEPFFVDFGPLNLACLYKFCAMLERKLNDPQYKNCKIYYYTNKNPKNIANATYLMACFQVITLKRHPAEAYSNVHDFAKQNQLIKKKKKMIVQRAVPFRDASMGLCAYKCTVEHCCWAVYRAMQQKCLSFDGFKVDEYEHYERVDNGDLNVIIPRQFIAFAGPNDSTTDEEGYPALTPHFYIPIWKKFGVTTVIRLNKICYDKGVWTQAGIEHFDLYFVDGTTPSDDIIQRFLQICENAKGTIAVHCKAGLGRTGSLIGCYLMKHYCWTAGEVIAWLRICRPGSVIGPQQFFLEEFQSLAEKQFKKKEREREREDKGKRRKRDKANQLHQQKKSICLCGCVNINDCECQMKTTIIDVEISIQLTYDPRIDVIIIIDNNNNETKCIHSLFFFCIVTMFVQTKETWDKDAHLKDKSVTLLDNANTTQKCKVGHVQANKNNETLDTGNQNTCNDETKNMDTISSKICNPSSQSSNWSEGLRDELKKMTQSAMDLLVDATMKTTSYVNPLLLGETLPTDPGQNQGKALLDAKRRHSPIRIDEGNTNNATRLDCDNPKTANHCYSDEINSKCLEETKDGSTNFEG
ncbi:hypothetical protein RFI_02472 [Reticulomyxa filosa]|uniref:protein-tyrosine-phosphatase n=1 Tax=Reticulomyxa filosa TaxID=46433 RepID=X6P7W6_RETFI|nr:hypothetical protein RFI_02472 [Reticulomyxa filosa]|eukprot:ETO34620.1 hypothetical protein RFI_02472 [Reticulomyxa filosa]